MEKRVRDVIGGAIRPNDARRFLVEAMIGAMSADGAAAGAIDARAQAVLDRYLAEHALFAGVPPAAARTLIELATDAVRFAGGAAARIPAIARGLPARIHRICAYGMACEIVQADREVTHAEAGFVEQLRQAVRVGPHEAQEIVHALHAGRLAAHLDDRVLRIKSLVPVAVELFTLRAHSLGNLRDDHRFAIRDFFLAMPDLALSRDDLEGALFHAFRKPRAPGAIVQELVALAQTLPDVVDRWWMVVYALAAEPPGSLTRWRVIPFAGQLQHVFGLADGDMDLAAHDAALVPAQVPRP